MYSIVIYLCTYYTQNICKSCYLILNLNNLNNKNDLTNSSVYLAIVHAYFTLMFLEGLTESSFIRALNVVANKANNEYCIR